MTQPSNVRRILAGRPDDRSLDAYITWIVAFTAALVGSSPVEPTDPEERAKYADSHRAYWQAMDQAAE